MTSNMKMETQAGGVGKAIGRMFSGESMFQNKYTAEGSQGLIAFASSFPGEIRALQIAPGQSIVAQKSAFLAAEPGVELSIHFKKKLGAGFFGGEGFIMQKLSGSGTAFVEIDGSVVEYQLAAGQTMLLDTGYLAMMDETVQMDIEMVKGVKNIFLGGEGLFNTKVTGPRPCMDPDHADQCGCQPHRCTYSYQQIIFREDFQTKDQEGCPSRGGPLLIFKRCVMKLENLLRLRKGKSKRSIGE